MSITIGRFIPARAGNGWKFRLMAEQPTVHPRACGERVTDTPLPRVGFGSSPRVRGTDVGELPAFFQRRFIPARAGNGSEEQTVFGTISVHPRACGERHGTTLCGIDFPGSSPRVRGTVMFFYLVA